MKKTLLTLSIITLCACSNTPKKAVAVKIGDEYYQTDQASSFELTKTGDKSKIVCQSHRKTGSHLKMKTCTTKEQRDIERRQAEEMRRTNSIHNNIRQTREYSSEGGR